MERRTLKDIKHDLRANYANAGIGRQMKSASVQEYFLREARAMERELELRLTGYVLTTA